jgi:hypothetical protein
MSGILAESIVAVVSVASKARAIEWLNNTKWINSLLKNIKKDKSSDSLSQKINKVLDNPCFRKKNGISWQTVWNWCRYIPNPKEKTKNKISHIFKPQMSINRATWKEEYLWLHSLNELSHDKYAIEVFKKPDWTIPNTNIEPYNAKVLINKDGEAIPKWNNLPLDENWQPIEWDLWISSMFPDSRDKNRVIEEVSYAIKHNTWLVDSQKSLVLYEWITKDGSMKIRFIYLNDERLLTFYPYID